MTAPLRMSFDVTCSATHAFRVWTSGISSWWPPGHTVTGRAATVVRQAGVGGRIYERIGDGIEHRVWERLGPSAEQWRDRNQGGWESLLPHFITAINEGER